MHALSKAFLRSMNILYAELRIRDMACSSLGYNENIQYQCQTHKSNTKPLRKSNKRNIL